VKGCEAKGTMSDMRRHEDECPYLVVLCTHQRYGCRFSAERRVVVPHELKCEVGLNHQAQQAARDAAERVRKAQAEVKRRDEERKRKLDEEAKQRQVIESKEQESTAQRAASKAKQLRASALIDSSKLVQIDLRVGLDRFTLSASLLTGARLGGCVLGVLARQALEEKVTNPCITLDRDGSVYKYIVEWAARSGCVFCCVSRACTLMSHSTIAHPSAHAVVTSRRACHERSTITS